MALPFRIYLLHFKVASANAVYDKRFPAALLRQGSENGFFANHQEWLS